MHAVKWSAAFYVLAIVISLQLTATAGSVTLRKLSRFRRRCYKGLPMCIMQSNNESSRGCGQCDADVREAPVRELRSLEEITQVARQQNDRAIALVPERVFFSKRVRSGINFWNSIDAVLVYEGPPRRADEFLDENVDNETTQDLLFNYSLEETEPNRLYNFYGEEGSGEKCQGRPRRNLGDCTFQQFIPFNIFHINSSLADEILSQASRFRDPTIIPNGNNKGAFSPQYKLQSIGRMWACASTVTPTPSTIITNESNANVDNAGSSVTSEQCLRDRTCLPIGGHSVWSALGRVNSTVTSDAPRKYLFITAPMDSYAFFPEFGMGAGAEISSLAVLMAVAEAVANYWRQATGEGDFERQPVYFAFNAETWGYAGSARFLRDMLEFECDEEQDISEGRKGCKKPFINNLKFKEFEGADIQVLNLGQLITPSTGNSPPTSQFFTHHDDALGESLEEMLNNTFMSQDLSLERGGFDFDSEEPVTPIDASQSFNFFFNDSRIDVVSVTNYPLNFSTEIYHSMLDTELRISQPAQKESMYKAANAIATAIVNIAFEDPREILANSNTIDNVITCMTGNWTNCSMVREYLGEDYENMTVTPGTIAAAKLALVQAFFAHHNRFNESSENCNNKNDCEDYDRDINRQESPQTQGDLVDAQCTRRRCVLSDTYTHRAFGGGINMVDSIGGFELEKRFKREEFDGHAPRQGDWTESFWDPEIGFVGKSKIATFTRLLSSEWEYVFLF
ncbi:Nicastrin [Gracilaria domingensis]|nr:Nicastrin [Gracilaria domingensis]